MKFQNAQCRGFGGNAASTYLHSTEDGPIARNWSAI